LDESLNQRDEWEKGRVPHQPLPFFLLSKKRFVSLSASLVSNLIFHPILVAAITGIGGHVFGILLKHLQTYLRLDDFKVMGVDVSRLSRRCGLHHMTERTSTGSCGLWGIVVLGVVSDGCWIGKLFILSVAGETKGVIEIGFDQLESTRPAMRIMAIKAGHLSLEMGAP
jgi:hypothetical protein